ncbi:uncharacterized protein RHOBADRAFT_47646 [Rhodotorula graminis WP1]|uniref:Uncharacterized protein n=1 Tax=Rhodotorula graminis (strain WP1) TaxID=578459 RepID=A0A0P9EQ93_RHOGW|nr:uncharacterized protein RHOBADRAFT_47646 [Rhodotorula graminis WP1]KPV71689.1 hypothetical protein RHOBADRAFT_47646 [Rhodotorula graminis WP1]
MREPSAPPPVYYPGAARRRSTNPPDLASGLAPSTNTASTASCTVQWAYHPCAPDAQGGNGTWGRRLRLAEVWRALACRDELLYDGWPRQFGGRDRVPWDVARRDRDAAATGPAVDEEHGAPRPDHRRTRSRALSLSLSLSRRTTTGADSGVALTPHSTHYEAGTHPLAPLYKKRVADLNALIQGELVTARLWLALVETLDYVWIVALVVALAQGKGVQTGFLKGVEIGLVLVILLNGLAINAVRMRRYTLARALKTRTRDWSPLALTSTNAGLMRNYLDGDAEPREGMDSVPVKDGPVMRWRMRETEGGFWLGYRPIVRVELVTPSSFSNPAAYLPVVDPELGAPPQVLGLEPDELDLEPPNGAHGSPRAPVAASASALAAAPVSGLAPTVGEGAGEGAGAAGGAGGSAPGEATSVPVVGAAAGAGPAPVVGEPPRYEDAH